MMTMNKGDIIWFGEAKNSTLGIVVSNNESNRWLDRLQVVPLEKSKGMLYAGEVELRVQGKRCKAVAHRLATVPKNLYRGCAGTLTPEELIKLNIVLQVQLGLL